VCGVWCGAAVGGQDKLRALWRHYFKDNDAIIWVVDTVCGPEHDRPYASTCFTPNMKGGHGHLRARHTPRTDHLPINPACPLLMCMHVVCVCVCVCVCV
jgi:hypothetical protein